MKEEILRLREEGKNYNEIVKIIGCSKSTVSYHCGEGQKLKTRIRNNNFKKGLSGEKRTKTIKKCLICDKPLRRLDSKYCNMTCHSIKISEQVVEKWLKGLILGHGGKTNVLKSPIRKYILKLNNYSCSICGWNKRHPIDNRPLVEIDHIDGKSENSRPENLRVLCPNCHSETPTFRGRNKKSTRIRK